jgi:hypothetical protein
VRNLTHIFFKINLACLLEKRKSNEVSFDLAGKKKIIMAKPFLLFPSFNFALLSVYMSTTLK